MVFLFLLIPFIASAQIRDWPDDEREDIKINNTESNVPHYTLPDLLTLSNGEKVRDVKMWNDRRLPEILKLLEENQFGRALGKPDMHLKNNSHGIVLFPANRTMDVNPDTHLKLTFPDRPVIGDRGYIRIYDDADDRLVDVLDLSIPAGPTKPTPSPDADYTPVPYEYVSGQFNNANTKAGTPSGMALPTPDTYQLTIIGGFTDGFHFHPIIVRDNSAAIYPHNNLLEYGKTYYVKIDDGVLNLKDGSFKGIKDKNTWQFTTKKAPPLPKSERIVVSDDGTGDFNTVQGAIDFIPDHNPKRVTVFIRNGIYEEIVYFRNKSNITILGEDRDKVVIQSVVSQCFC